MKKLILALPFILNSFLVSAHGTEFYHTVLENPSKTALGVFFSLILLGIVVLVIYKLANR